GSAARTALAARHGRARPFARRLWCVGRESDPARSPVCARHDQRESAGDARRRRARHLRGGAVRTNARHAVGRRLPQGDRTRRGDRGGVMRFLRPELGWWLLAVLAVLSLLRWRVRRTFVASPPVRWLGAPRYRASWLRRLPRVVLAAALLLLVCALMEPVLPYAQTEIRSRGLDIVIALDLSSSMLEEMGRVRPPRTFQNLT